MNIPIAFNPPRTDARTVRPYISIMASLMRKMVERASRSNACRDARPVRPLKQPCMNNGKYSPLIIELHPSFWSVSQQLGIYFYRSHLLLLPFSHCFNFA